jgi:hypothetical protein
MARGLSQPRGTKMAVACFFAAYILKLKSVKIKVLLEIFNSQNSKKV